MIFVRGPIILSKGDFLAGIVLNTTTDIYFLKSLFIHDYYPFLSL
jgi:hypothetical protein